MVQIRKKTGLVQEFDSNKIISAVSKSADRVNVELTPTKKKKIIDLVLEKINDMEVIDVKDLHNIVELSLDDVDTRIAKSYREYRNYKLQFVKMMDEVYRKKLSLNNIQDASNANADSALITTQKAITYSELNGELYRRFFLTDEEESAMKDGYIYIHDRGSRLDMTNCCLFDMKSVLTGGFEMGNMHYNEPKSIGVAFSVMLDVIFNAGSSQYGGFTVSEVDKLLAPYAEKSYNEYYKEYEDIKGKVDLSEADLYATKKLKRELEQHVQAMEMKLNSCETSRGDYIFTSISFGLSKDRFGQMISSAILKVRKEGQGKDGFKRPVLFPKLTFLYDENLHGKGKELEWLFLEAVDCTMRAQYPDFLSMTGDGYAPSIYKKYGVTISRMGCVDPQESVIYKINNVVKVTSIKSMWDSLSSIFKIHNQKEFGYSFGEVIPLTGVSIFDKDSFVDCKCIIKNDETTDWYKVSLTNGRSLICTGDHPWTIGNEVKTTKELKLDDTVEVIDSLPEMCGDSEEKDLAWLEALIMCDGSYDHTLMICLGLDEYDIVNKIKEISQRLFNYTPYVREQHRGEKGNYIEVKFLVKEAPKSIKDFINKLNLDFKSLRKENREIPEWVFTATKETQLSFLAGIIDADGYINDGRKSPLIQIGSTNKVLSLQQMALAQMLNIPVHIYENQYNKNKPEKIRYRVEFKFIPGLKDYIASSKKMKHVLNESKHTNFQSSKIVKIEKLTISQNSYDVMTDSEHFYCSGIRSHNCRANLSPWYEKGGIEPADEKDKPVYEGRFNCGAISLHFPMIVAKAKEEGKDFFDVLEYYLQLARKIHIRTLDFLSHKKAGINPLAFCQGGFYKGNKKPDEELGREFFRPSTVSFGITALNEATVMYNGKTIYEDHSEFAEKVLKYVNDFANKYKKEDGVLYAIYGTPAESLCFLQVKQFRKKYGIIKGVSDREYMSNSFHMHVSEDITPIEKQDAEYKCFHLCNGGNIMYNRFTCDYNKEAYITLIRRAMRLGYYYGCNQSKDYCKDCGKEFLDLDKCPKCGSDNIVRIERVCGYLSYSRVGDKTRMNEGKLAEIKDRKSM